MFAVVEILNQKLYATALPDGDDSFTKCFRQWQDPMYVRQYLQSQPSTHEFYHVGLKEASKIVLRESNYLINEINQILKGDKPDTTLDGLFKPLHHNDDFHLQRIPAKAYGSHKGKSFIRLYAIRFSDGCYLVVGGLLKMHPALQDSEEGRAILTELRKWSDYLKKNDIDGAFELVALVHEK